MNADRTRIVDRVKIAIAAEHRPDAVGRPALDLAAEFADQRGKARELVAIVGLGDVEPAVLRIDTRHLFMPNDVADIIEPALRQRPEILGVVEADPRDDAVRAGGKAGQDESGIAPGGVSGDAPGLQEHDRPTSAGELARDRQTRKPAADHADLGVDFGAERRPRRRIDHGRRVPSVAIGRCGIGCVHRSANFGALEAQSGTILYDFARIGLA